MSLLRGVRRALVGQARAWTPSTPTGGGYTPEHWYRSDGPLWQDAGTTPAVSDGDDVGRWEDKTANADHVNQAVALDKPHLENASADRLNGHPVIRFDGANHYLQGAFTTGGAMAQPFTIFAVAALDAAAVNDDTSRFIMDGDDHALRVICGVDKTAAPDEWGIYAGSWLSNNATDSNWNIWTAVFNGASSQFWHNGISEASGNPGAKTMDGITIGASYVGSAFWDGDMTEIIIYNTGLSDADKNQVGRYLRDRYSLSYTDI